MVFREINYLIRLWIVEAFRIQQRTPGRLLFGCKTLPDRIRFQVAAKVSEGQGRIKLGKGFAATLRLDESDFTNPFRQVPSGQLTRSGGLRISGEGAHKCTP